MTDRDIVILGGGIIGICAAAYLAEAGCGVTVIDRTGICEETSSGNAGALAFSDVLPLAQKNMLRQVPGWLLDPLGPLTIPPAYLPQIAPWLFRFWRAGRGGQFDQGVAAQASLMKLAQAEWTALMRRSGTGAMLREDGSLELYESEREFAASLPGWTARERFGIPFEHLARTRLADHQPGLSEDFVRGTFVPGWKTVSDPRDLGQAIWRYAEAHGAVLARQTAIGAGSDDKGVHVGFADGSSIRADKLVIAAGAWSHRFARVFGDRLPLETERGYNTTLPADAFDVKRQLIFSGAGFVITPLSTGLRIGGAVELAGLTRAPNFARAKAMLEKARRFLPGLNTAGGREWMGFRPSLPDSLPVIGRARSAPRVIYAFGHGHLGLTQASATGRLVSQLVLDEKPAIDLSPFSSRRFQLRATRM